MNVGLFVVQRIRLISWVNRFYSTLEMSAIYLNFRLQYKMGVARVSESKNSPKMIKSEITNVANLQFRGLHASRERLHKNIVALLNTNEARLGSHLKFYNFNSVRYDRRFVALIEGRIEHLNCIIMKLV